MIQLPELYPHQETFRDSLRSALAKHIRVIACAQAGFGKTRTSKWILGTTANREPTSKQSGRSLFAVYGRNLVDNAAKSFDEHPSVPFGIVMSDRASSYGKRIQIGSIDTMLSWFIDDGSYSTDITFDLIVYDEADAHHSKFARFLQYHDAKRQSLGLNPAYVIGLTATPRTKGLADVYKELVLGPSTEWLTENGFLSPFRYFRATLGKMGLLVKRGDSFTEESESAAMEGLAGDLVRDWKKFADGRRTAGFFPRRSHAQDAMAKLSEAGLRVAYVDGNTSDDERNQIFKDIARHSIDYLCNVRVLGRGTDIPEIECVQLCVAIGSVSAFRQYIGRGSRVSPATGKKDCIVIDHGNNVLRHGFFIDDPKWSLDITEKDPGEQGHRPTIECPRCQRIYRGGKCVCGYEPTQRERRAQGLRFDGVELVEVTREKKKDASGPKTPEELMVSAMFIAGRSKNGMTWRQCVGNIFKEKCKKQGTPDYRVPSSVQIAGKRYRLPRFGSDDSFRRVAQLYPIVTQGGKHGGDYLVQEQQHSEPQW